MSIFISSKSEKSVVRFYDSVKVLTYPKTLTLHMNNDYPGEVWLEPRSTEPWTGEGLPPVGTVCETECGGLVRRVEVLALTETNIFIREIGDIENGREWLCSLTNPGTRTWRPIRTPEQVAADENRAAVEALAADTNWTLPKEACEAVIAAGYCKSGAQVFVEILEKILSLRGTLEMHGFVGEVEAALAKAKKVSG